MEEIERIIDKKLNGLRFFNGEKVGKGKSYEMHKEHRAVLTMVLAKAFEQYVLKARIETLENVKARELALLDYKNRDYIIRLEQEIAELREKLND